MISAKIKMLEWHNFDAWTYWAEGACGTYHIEERNGYWQVELRVGGLVHGVTQTDDTTPADLDAAKAAAQADYESRILSVLEWKTTVSPEVQALVVAVRESQVQIAYLHERLGKSTGSGNAVMARNAAALRAIKEGEG